MKAIYSERAGEREREGNRDRERQKKILINFNTAH